MRQGKRLPRSYFLSEEVTVLAKDLLGKYLVTSIQGHYCSGKIVETEAYRGPDDRACHAFNHRRTSRTAVMFEQGGVAYIYICYGMHHLMNVVTGPKNFPHAILIRALEPEEGVKIMAVRRQLPEADHRLTRGPGALSVALGLTSNLSGTVLFKKASPIWIEDRGIFIEPERICTGPRIGVESAGEAALWPWRFFIRGNKYVSATKSCG